LHQVSLGFFDDIWISSENLQKNSRFDETEHLWIWEYQTEDGEALRDDENFMYVASWEFKGEHNWELHKEELKYEVIKPSQRNYK